jgi:prevent-host-death family protein
MTNMARRGSPIVVNVADAKARLPELLRRAAAGEEIVIARANRPVAKLVPLPPAQPRRPGTGRGLFRMAPDFDDTPEDFEPYLR